MTSDLSTPARQALIALMVRVTPASNPELRQHYRVEIGKAAREELKGAELISAWKGARNAIFHELTDRGWARARQEFLAPPPEKVAGAWLLHYATLRHLASWMERDDRKLADVFAGADPGPEQVTPAADGAEVPPVEERIKRACRDLAKHPGATVSLFELRQRLGDVARADLDRTLWEMDRRREIHLDPDPGRNALPQEARDAAIAVGGEDKHLISLGEA